MLIEYILTLVISFLGILLGGVLALIAPEELKAGEKYWKILEWFLLIIIIAVLIYYSSNLIIAILLTALLVGLKIIKKEYPAMAFALFLGAYDNFLFLIGSLIFLYGLPKGTLDSMKIINVKNAKKQRVASMYNLFKKNVLYLILGIIMIIVLII